MKGKHIAVWFSCGAASAVAAKLTIDTYGAANRISIVNNPIREEHKDNQRFLMDVEKWLGVPVQFATSAKYPGQSCEEVWEKRKFMSGPTGAPCTIELKKVARQEWEARNRPDFTVLGFTAEEEKRAERFRLTERDTLLTPLIDAGMTKQNCFDMVQQAGIELPQIYSLGFPNANCIGCVKATSPTYWNLVRETFPKIFASRQEQSSRIGARLVRHKGERILLEDLPPDARGRSLKSYDFECGIFCEERQEGS